MADNCDKMSYELYISCIYTKMKNFNVIHGFTIFENFLVTKFA